jgi:hypothetical protein
MNAFSRRFPLLNLVAVASLITPAMAMSEPASTRRSAIAATTLAALAALSGASASAQSPEQLKEAQAIAEEAYLYGFPMIVNYEVMYDYAIDRASGQFKAPFNVISNEARVFTPKDTTIVTPNSDTPYSVVALDLRAEPIVLCMPEIDKARYCDVQLVDLYTDNYGYMGQPHDRQWRRLLPGDRAGLERRRAARCRRDVPERDAVQHGDLPHPAVRSRRHGQRKKDPGRLQGSDPFRLSGQARSAARAGGRVA